MYKYKAHTTLMLVIVLIAIISMTVLPVPSWLLDLGLSFSFAASVMIFAMALYCNTLLDFSTFPTILLSSIILRLSLNISSTKLIIGEGHNGSLAAGNVIHSFSMFVMGGSFVIGLVVFCILLIVNFVVITKGAARMAEVGARFALDGMPGKQLAIDSDLSSGAIDHAEAKQRREREQREATFFGSLDGVSKFVKGDAIAGLMITLLNLVVGLVIGTIVHGMAIGTAIETYATLTVGDGLVTQIPAVIISIASGLLLSRAGTTGPADIALIEQIGRFPQVLAAVGILMALFGFLPGLPFIPFASGAILFCLAAYWSKTQISDGPNESSSEEKVQDVSSKDVHIGDMLDLEDIHVKFSPDLVSSLLDQSTGLEARIESMRNHIAEQFGLILPDVRLTDDVLLSDGMYSIMVQGVEQGKGTLYVERSLAIISSDNSEVPNGIDVNEPVYGAPARWIDKDAEEQAILSGITVVSATEVLATHILETVKSNFGRLLTLKSLRRLLDEFVNLSDPSRAESNRRLIEELIPDKVPVDLLLSVLRLLLEERVSIRNLPAILETIAETRGAQVQPSAICEAVRHRLGFQIIAPFKRADGTLPLVQLAPEWEERFTTFQVDGERGQKDIALPPEEFNRLATSLGEKIAKASENGVYPVVVTSTRRRRFLSTVLAASNVRNPVISFDELGTDVKPSLVGLVAA